MPISGRMDKGNVTYPDNAILVSLKNEGNSAPATTWMNRVSEISQPRKDKHGDPTAVPGTGAWVHGAKDGRVIYWILLHSSETYVYINGLFKNLKKKKKLKKTETPLIP